MCTPSMTDGVLLTGKLHVPTVFEKLNLKNQTEIVVLNPPASFEPALAELDRVTVQRDLGAVELVNFSLAFAMTQAEVDRLSELLILKANGDAILWFAYPKGTSKKYQCDFNRDTGWPLYKRRDSIQCVKSPSTKTGRLCGFGVCNLSNPGKLDSKPTERRSFF